MDSIRFYRRGDPYGEFSNFYCAKIIIDGKEWYSTEAYFQGQKFLDEEIQESFRKMKSPSESAKRGRDKKLPLRKDWEDVKDDVMREALHAKFTQHEKLKELLLSTGERELIEHTKNDSYWADGGDGTGKNMLGKLLMELREKLRNL